MFRVPWITLVLFALICVSPLGQEIYHSLHSGEQLARTLAQAVLLIYLPIIGLLILAETGIRFLILRRRRKTGNAVRHELDRIELGRLVVGPGRKRCRDGPQAVSALIDEARE